MTPPVSFWSLVLLALMIVSRVPAAAPPTPGAPGDLVVVAEPAASDSLADPAAIGPATLVYRVVEIFDGEPGSASIVVRHDALTSEERARLREGERVILLARPDPMSDGRWMAPAPLRATPSALAAFRKWSAPEDVRAPRPLRELVAEVNASTQAEVAPERGAPPARDASPAPVSFPAPVPAAASVAAPLAGGGVEVEEESILARHETPAPAVKPAPAMRQSVPAPSAPQIVAQGKGSHAPPLLYYARVQPPRGPGLPPSPTSAVLGPPHEEREDLKPPARGGNGR